MKKLHPSFLSQTRQRVSNKLTELKRLYMLLCTDEILFHGLAGEVYRKCGKQNCKCSQGGEHRHGPYRIIRVFRDSKNTQITVLPSENHFIKFADRYQKEIGWRKDIVKIHAELLGIVDNLMESRTIWHKKEYKKGKSK